MPQAPAESESRGGDLPPDRERVERAVRDLKNGKRVDENFDFLFRRFSEPLFRQLISWGADAEEARDLNQQIFQRIFQCVETFKGGSHLFESWVGWVWKIARTTWLRSERYRRAAKRPQHLQPLGELDERGEPTTPPAQLNRVLDREAVRQVREAIDELPEQELKCMILHYYQGMKTREIAVVLRIAPGTVKAHLNHARTKLKRRLGEYFDFGDEGQTDSKPKEQRV